MRPALIVACSQRKTNQPGPAITVYDGQLFRILRKYQPNVDLFVLSAKYGLIEAEKVIESYDQRLPRNAWRDTKWAGENITAPVWLFLGAGRLSDTQALHVCAGQDYLDALNAGWPRHVCPVPKRVPAYPAPIGKMQAALKEFCLSHSAAPSNPPEWVKVL